MMPNLLDLSSESLGLGAAKPDILLAPPGHPKPKRRISQEYRAIKVHISELSISFRGFSVHYPARLFVDSFVVDCY